MGKEKGHPMGGLSLSRSEEHNCAFCENAVHNPDHRIAIGIFDPSQNAQASAAKFVELQTAKPSAVRSQVK
jgi:hypothetical protein